MRKATLFIFLFFSITFRAQTAAEVDSIVRLYPKRFVTADDLAKKIRTDFSTDFGKARAIFSWLAFNITYDVKAYLHPKPAKKIKYKTPEEKLRKQKELHDKMIAKVLHKRKAICSGYSELYNYLALEVGLECQVNSGDAKNMLYDIGRRRIRTIHAWNSVKIDGTWRLLDATWGAGFVDLQEEKFYRKFHPIYFDMEPKQFFKEHYPKKGIWQDTIVVNKEEFLKSPLVQDAILEGTYEMTAPGSGVIEICPDDTVTFKIRNLKQDSRVRYSLKKKGTTASVTDKIFNGDEAQFEIKIDKTIGRYLTIYVDGTPLATYRINRYSY